MEIGTPIATDSPTCRGTPPKKDHKKRKRGKIKADACDGGEIISIQRRVIIKFLIVWEKRTKCAYDCVRLSDGLCPVEVAGGFPD